MVVFWHVCVKIQNIFLVQKLSVLTLTSAFCICSLQFSRWNKCIHPLAAICERRKVAQTWRKNAEGRGDAMQQSAYRGRANLSILSTFLFQVEICWPTSRCPGIPDTTFVDRAARIVEDLSRECINNDDGEREIKERAIAMYQHRFRDVMHSKESRNSLYYDMVKRKRIVARNTENVKFILWKNRAKYSKIFYMQYIRESSIFLATILFNCRIKRK